MIVFGIVFLLIYGALVFYIGWSGWGFMKSWVKDELSWKVRILYILTLTIVSTSFILGRFFENTLLRHAERMVEEMNALHPDVIVFPGDIVDDDINPFVNQKIAEVLAELEAPLGVYMSLGNHDKHNGPIEELIDTLEKGDLKVLYDEVVPLKEDVVLIGRRDRTNRNRLELSDLTSDIGRSKTVILLEHQPYDLDIDRDIGVDIMLSGHTHLGQIFPGSLITRRIYENDWGYSKLDSLHSIVSMGYGFWGPPIRLGTRSEIVQIFVTIE